MAKKSKNQPTPNPNTPPQEGVVVGIDLGTTNSAVAIFTADGKPEIINNLDGQRTTPSVVNLQDENNAVVGQAALNMLALAAAYIVRWIKRMMGRVDSGNNPLPGFIHPDSGRVYMPEEVASYTLKYIKDSVETVTGKKVLGAVITVPAYFKDAERRATIKAGELAGLRVLRIVNEPTAAAIAYGLDKGIHGNLLVFDWGGGTIDVTVLKIEAERFTVLSTAGAIDVGGSDLDLLIAARILAQFKAQNGLDITPESDLAAYLDVVGKAEQIKKDLRQAISASAVIYCQGQRMVFTLTRDELNALATDLVDKTMQLAAQAVKEAGLDWAQIDHILMTGGSSRLAIVKEKLATLSGKTPRMDKDPDTAVAEGAAIVAAGAIATLPEPEQEKVVDLDGRRVLPPPDLSFHDVTAHGLGCLAKRNGQGLRNAVIIPRNTPIPAKMIQVFDLESEHQSEARIMVVQGDDGETPDHCTSIGEVVLRGLPPGSPQNRIQVEFGYNAQGLLSVTATDLMSGISTNGVIEHLAAIGSVQS